VYQRRAPSRAQWQRVTAPHESRSGVQPFRRQAGSRRGLVRTLSRPPPPPTTSNRPRSTHAFPHVTADAHARLASGLSVQLRAFRSRSRSWVWRSPEPGRVAAHTFAHARKLARPARSASSESTRLPGARTHACVRPTSVWQDRLTDCFTKKGPLRTLYSTVAVQSSNQATSCPFKV